MRILAATALNIEKKYLTTEISQAVILGGELGFKVDFEYINKLTKINQTKNLPSDKLPNTTKKIA